MFFVLKLFSISLSQKFSFIELLTGGKSYVNRVSVSKKTKMKQRACVCVCCSNYKLCKSNIFVQPIAATELPHIVFFLIRF